MPRTGNRERLERLRALLLTINPAEFHMSFWSTTGGTRCAIGHAMFDEWFQREGLTPFPEGPADLHWPVFTDGDFKAAGYFAVGKFFNLPRKVTAWLFNPAGYFPNEHGDVHAVIRKLDRLLAGEEIKVHNGYSLPLEGGDTV